MCLMSVFPFRYAKREDASEELTTAMEGGEKADIEKYSKRTVKVCLEPLLLMLVINQSKGNSIFSTAVEAFGVCLVICCKNIS
jgi:flap endonuclease-1